MQTYSDQLCNTLFEALFSIPIMTPSDLSPVISSLRTPYGDVWPGLMFGNLRYHAFF